MENELRPLTDRSPLRYPGGKSKAVKIILDIIPSGLNEICSPFLGGASVELALQAKQVDVHAGDSFEPLVNFWNQAKATPWYVAEAARRHLPLSKEQFYHLRKTCPHIEDEIERAAAFFVLNRSSFSGSTLSGGMSPGHPRFNSNAIDRVSEFRAPFLSVRHEDFEVTIKQHPGMFLFLDPPYDNGGSLYGVNGDQHKGFDHEKLAQILHERDTHWLLCYNDSPRIREWYADYCLIFPKWKYGMSANKSSSEIIITNF